MNAVERVMAQWNAIHPFNVFVAVRIQGGTGDARLRAAASECGAAIEVRPAAGQDAGRHALERIADEALNRPFRADEPPRCVVLPADGQQWISLSLPHQRADGHAALARLVRLVSLGLGVNPPAALPFCDGPRVPLRRAMNGFIPVHTWPSLVLQTASEFRQFAGCHRPAFGDPADGQVSVRAVPIPADTRIRARSVARRHAATSNDVILAALADAVLHATADDRRRAGRRAAAFAVPVSLRALNRGVLDHADGVYVSCLDVLFTDSTSGVGILRQACRRTAAEKVSRRHLRSLGELWLAARAFRGLRARERPLWFARQKPYCGVMTSPRVAGEWLTPEVAAACDRWSLAVSPGPMSPLVAALTGAGDRLECTISTRAYGYSPPQIAAIVTGFCDRLGALA